MSRETEQKSVSMSTASLLSATDSSFFINTSLHSPNSLALIIWPDFVFWGSVFCVAGHTISDFDPSLPACLPAWTHPPDHVLEPLLVEGRDDGAAVAIPEAVAQILLGLLEQLIVLHGIVLLGGAEIGSETLLRWYVLHVLFLPFVIVIFMAIHFWRVRKDGGISGPL